MGLVFMAVSGVGFLMVGLSLNLITGWTMDPMCPGDTAFCDGVWWTFVVEWLPTWLYVGQMLVVLSLASPWAVVRMRG